MTGVDSTVQAANLLTRRWAAELDADANDVISGAGAWLLLVTLLAGASGEAQTELERATLVERGEAASAVQRLLESLDSAEGLRNAVGLWVRSDVPLHADLTATMERVTIAPLPADRSDLDLWARDRTGGLIAEFPGDVTGETLVVAASALAMEADWVAPFEVGEGQWRGGGEWLGWLHRTGRDRDPASLLRTDVVTVGRVVCPTMAGFEVHLVSGSPTDAPGEVLGLAIDALHDAVEQVGGSALRPDDRGGCVSAQEMPVLEPGPELRLSLPAFEIRSRHDMLARPGLFGLTAAMDDTRGHFPHLSPVPLFVNAAAQAALAAFTACGFRAATVSMAELNLGAARSHTGTVVVAEFNRPFGFLVVDPHSRLVLAAGWVAEPEQDFDPGEDEFLV